MSGRSSPPQNRSLTAVRKARCCFCPGPSASSKTTTAGKIAAQLEHLGVQTAVISLDDFFKNRADLPLLPNGETDFESIHTLDLDTLRACFNTLLAAGEAAFPTFDFTSGSRAKEVRRVKAGHGTVLIVEGIHALNPQITENCARDGFQRLYISPNSDYEEDGKLVLTAREIPPDPPSCSGSLLPRQQCGKHHADVGGRCPQ